MERRKGLVIVIVIVCFGLAGLSYFVLAPRKSTETSEYEASKSRSEEMARKQLEAAPPRPVPEEDFEPPTGKGPQRIGG